MKFEDFSSATKNERNLYFAKAAEILAEHPNCTSAERERYRNWQCYYEEEYTQNLTTYHVMVRMSTAAIADSRLISINAESKSQAMKLAIDNEIVNAYSSQFTKASFQPYVTMVYTVVNGELVETWT